MTIVQSLWIGPVGLLQKISMASFVANGHEYHLYGYEKFSDLPAGVVQRDAAEILPQSRVFRYKRGRARGGLGGFANLFRYHMLEKNGGWWCDTDMICVRPLPDKEIVFASERHWVAKRKISNAAICVPAGHALIRAVREEADAINPITMRFAKNGAPLLRKHLLDLGLKEAVMPPEAFNPVDWWKAEELTRPGTAGKISEKTYCVHCFHESWRWKHGASQHESFNEVLFPADTLLGSLQRRYLPMVKGVASE